jgi:hypothetical protein
VLITQTLAGLQAPIRAEEEAAKAAWPTIAGGLPAAGPPGRVPGNRPGNPQGGTPATITPALREAVQTAERRAGAIELPGYVTTEEGGLTGPAVGPAGLLKAYAALTARGWRFIAAAVAAEEAGSTAGGATGSGATGAAERAAGQSPAATRFLRENAGLYIYCVYDGHYDLSLIGKTLQNAYKKLGGEKAFGRSLTQREVETVASAYSIPAARLEPHPPLNLAV